MPDATCPSCGKPLKKIPTRFTPCPHCFVKIRGFPGGRVLTESQAAREARPSGCLGKVGCLTILVTAACVWWFAKGCGQNPAPLPQQPAAPSVVPPAAPVISPRVDPPKGDPTSEPVREPEPMPEPERPATDPAKREAAAAAQLKMAKALLEKADSGTQGKGWKRLEVLAKTYPETDAGKEAARLLDSKPVTP